MIDREKIEDKMAEAMYYTHFTKSSPYDVTWDSLKEKYPTVAKILIDYAKAAIDAMLGELPEPIRSTGKPFYEIFYSESVAADLYKELLAMRKKWIR